MSFINAGYENNINSEKVLAVVNASSRGGARLIKNAKEKGLVVDATEDASVESVVVMEGGQVVLSPVTNKTLSRRLNGKK